MHASESTHEHGGTSITEAVAACLQAESDRGLLPRSLTELRRYLTELSDACSQGGVNSPSQLTPVFVTDYVQQRCQHRGPSVLKAVVWAMRKLGGYLMLRGLVSQHPAAALKMPKVSPRAKLPQYLSAAQLRQLLESVARTRPRRDLVLLSLIASTGLRPHEVVSLERADLHLPQRWIDVEVKGAWRKHTPLSPAMATLLQDYLDARQDTCPAAFLSHRSRPLSVSGLQRMVRQAGEQAGLPSRLTPRQLRHTFATHAADRHGKVLTKALLGHRTLRATEIYTHLSPRRFQALMNRHPYHARAHRS